MSERDLDALCERYGIVGSYFDNWGGRHVASEATKRALLAAMGVDDGNSAAVAPALVVWREGDDGPSLDLPAIGAGSRLRWRVASDDGTMREGACDAGEGRVTCTAVSGLAHGYHRLTLLAGDETVCESTLAVCPRSCHRLPAGARVFGPAIQLYALRSQRNYGIGDFTDLAHVADIAAAHGASFVGVNPLHEPFLDRPAHASPYSPSTRLALNPLYLDVEAIAEFAECSTARELAASPAFRREIDALRRAPLVEYEKVAAAKRAVGDLVYAHFRERYLAAPSDRGQAFRAFVAAHRNDLGNAALFDAIQAEFSAADARVWGWPAWPEEYRNRASSAVDDFARDYAHRVEHYLYLQWQADLQLAQAQRRARDRGMAIGLYRDLAVGANPGGAETWQQPHAFATGVHVGAPPDEFNRGGQDWGLPPWIPHRLREAGYAPWIRLLRANMSHAGGLRIDHVMGLMRLFWIAQGGSPNDGAYVRYPLRELVALLALESTRERCIVVGEDLGTVPDEVRAVLREAGIHSYRVLYFERSDHAYRAPHEYPEQALVAVSTHDLPTWQGFHDAADLAARDALGRFATDEARQRAHVERRAEREALAEALAREGLTAADVHRYVARTPCALLTIQLEDVFGEREQANLPGTLDDQHPNWQRKVPLALEDWERDGRFAAVCASIRGEGRGPPA